METQRKRRKRRPNIRPSEGFHHHEIEKRYRGEDALKRDWITLTQVNVACTAWLRKRGLIYEDMFRQRADYVNEWRRNKRAELKEAA
jgi:hypothetical protein